MCSSFQRPVNTRRENESKAKIHLANVCSLFLVAHSSGGERLWSTEETVEFQSNAHTIGIKKPEQKSNISHASSSGEPCEHRRVLGLSSKNKYVALQTVNRQLESFVIRYCLTCETLLETLR